MDKILVIDPGFGGGMAYGTTMEDVQVCKMPKELDDIWYEFKRIEPDVVIIEDVGTYIPGNSGPSAATFAAHVGALKAFAVAREVLWFLVQPKAWIYAFVGQKKYEPRKIPEDITKAQRKKLDQEWKKELGRRKRERKGAIADKASELFPEINVTLATADALGMYWYTLKHGYQPDLFGGAE